jgi:hypothetical protein
VGKTGGKTKRKKGAGGKGGKKGVRGATGGYNGQGGDLGGGGYYGQGPGRGAGGGLISRALSSNITIAGQYQSQRGNHEAADLMTQRRQMIEDSHSGDYGDSIGLGGAASH